MRRASDRTSRVPARSGPRARPTRDRLHPAFASRRSHLRAPPPWVAFGSGWPRQSAPGDRTRSSRRDRRCRVRTAREGPRHGCPPLPAWHGTDPRARAAFEFRWPPLESEASSPMVARRDEPTRAQLHRSIRARTRGRESRPHARDCASPTCPEKPGPSFPPSRRRVDIRGAWPQARRRSRPVPRCDRCVRCAPGGRPTCEYPPRACRDGCNRTRRWPPAASRHHAASLP
jgi:hypothetical protein